MVLRHIAVIKIAQSAGIPLEEIRGPLSHRQQLTAEQWDFVPPRRKTTDERIQRLTVLRPSRQLHRLRLPVAHRLPAAQPKRYLGQQGAGAHIFDADGTPVSRSRLHRYSEPEPQGIDDVQRGRGVDFPLW